MGRGVRGVKHLAAETVPDSRDGALRFLLYHIIKGRERILQMANKCSFGGQTSYNTFSVPGHGRFSRTYRQNNKPILTKKANKNIFWCTYYFVMLSSKGVDQDRAEREGGKLNSIDLFRYGLQNTAGKKCIMK